jgi:putative ABC transport system ATP-binding protein
METLIKLENVTKSFSTKFCDTLAVKDASLSIEQGDFVVIMGESGSGKSSLLSIIGLLEQPTKGKVFVKETEAQKLTDNQVAEIRNKHIGYVFQSFNLIPEMNTFENVSLPLKYRGKENEEAVIEAIKKVNLTERKLFYPSQLSGGQQQRASIARAIVGSPSIILADEPTGNLDSQNSKNVIELLKSLNKEGTTVCMVTHDKSLSKYASKVVHMFDGQIQKVEALA